MRYDRVSRVKLEPTPQALYLNLLTKLEPRVMFATFDILQNLRYLHTTEQ
jgi:hypothetical protein